MFNDPKKAEIDRLVQSVEDELDQLASELEKDTLPEVQNKKVHENTKEQEKQPAKKIQNDD